MPFLCAILKFPPPRGRCASTEAYAALTLATHTFSVRSVCVCVALLC